MGDDQAGQRLTQTNGMGQTTHFAYDARGNRAMEPTHRTTDETMMMTNRLLSKTSVLRVWMALCCLWAFAATGQAQGVVPLKNAENKHQHPFERALAAGHYKEADLIAKRDLEEVRGKPGPHPPDAAERYLRAAKNATLWARWNEALQLLRTL